MLPNLTKTRKPIPERSNTVARFRLVVDFDSDDGDTWDNNSTCSSIWNIVQNTLPYMVDNIDTFTYDERDKDWQ